MPADDLLPETLVFAERCLREGRIAEGIEAYRKAVRLRADLPDAWYNLAYLERSARLFPDALASYDQALAHGVDRPEEVHVNRAAIFSEHLGDDGAAEQELRKAIEINPRFAVAWLNLGNLYEDLGRIDQARNAYESALAAAPGNGRALARLTALDVFAGQAAGRVATLRAALGRPGLSLDEAAEISFALGSALDALGDYQQAFQFFTRANRLVRDRLGSRGRYDPAGHESLIDRLISLPPLSPPSFENGEPPIFICGMFRSGSTLCEHLLGRHSRITAAGELDFIPALVADQLQPYPAALAGISADKLATYRDAYLAQSRRMHPGADLITDKRPDNFLHIGLIKALFPTAKIIHTVRDPLDNLLSVFFLYFADSITYGWSLEDITHWYGQYRRLMAHWKLLFGEDIHDLRYDDLVAEPEAVLADLLEFLSLDPEPLLIDREVGRSVRTPSAWQVRKPLYRRASGRWRNYAAHLAKVRDALGLS